MALSRAGQPQGLPKNPSMTPAGRSVSIGAYVHRPDARLATRAVYNGVSFHLRAASFPLTGPGGFPYY